MESRLRKSYLEKSLADFKWKENGKAVHCGNATSHLRLNFLLQLESTLFPPHISLCFVCSVSEYACEVSH